MCRVRATYRLKINDRLITLQVVRREGRETTYMRDDSALLLVEQKQETVCRARLARAVDGRLANKFSAWWACMSMRFESIIDFNPSFYLDNRANE